MNTLPSYYYWKSLSIKEIKLLFKDLDWILAGGFALELFYSNSFRKHDDIDIIIKREEQHKISNYFNADRIYIANTPGSLSLFNDEIYYSKPIQDIWILSEDYNSWCLQIMMVDVVNDFWIYKREEDIKLPFRNIYFEKEAIKILKPEIQLLYKSKDIRLKDQIDFEKIYPLLPEKAKSWLLNSLSLCYDKHKWTKKKRHI